MKYSRYLSNYFWF